MQFQLLRLVLLRRAQPDMFEERGPDGTEITREKWLRRIFTGNIEYQHRGSECHFVPAEDFDEAPFIVGRMGRKRKIDENEPPSSGLKETSRDTWKAAIVLIDPRHHDDGQKSRWKLMLKSEIRLHCFPPLQSTSTHEAHLSHTISKLILSLIQVIFGPSSSKTEVKLPPSVLAYWRQICSAYAMTLIRKCAR